MFKPKSPPSREVLNTLEAVDHSYSYGVVYANAQAAAEINKAKPMFPEGSILVRERHDSSTSKTPKVVIAMVKRHAGFSKESGDWEFLTMDGPNLQILSRQTAGRCAECHTKAQNTDWVFVNELKQ